MEFNEVAYKEFCLKVGQDESLKRLYLAHEIGALLQAAMIQILTTAHASGRLGEQLQGIQDIAHSAMLQSSMLQKMIAELGGDEGKVQRA